MLGPLHCGTCLLSNELFYFLLSKLVALLPLPLYFDMAVVVVDLVSTLELAKISSAYLVCCLLLLEEKTCHLSSLWRLFYSGFLLFACLQIGLQIEGDLALKCLVASA